MKKILLSILAIALTVGTVSASAYALFSDTVNVAGVTITSGNADLYIADAGTGIPVSDSRISGFLSDKLANLFPGKVDYTKMEFRNNSKSEIDLNLTAQLTNFTWTALGDQINMTIVEDSAGVYINGNLPTDGWKTLNQWSLNPVAFGSPLTKSTPGIYKVFIKVNESAGNSIALQTITGNLVFTGTQKQ